MTQHAPLILDIAGTRLTPPTAGAWQHPLAGGMILFARNWENRAQLGGPVRRHQDACAGTC